MIRPRVLMMLHDAAPRAATMRHLIMKKAALSVDWLAGGLGIPARLPP